jgi:hypothetical protein
VQVHRLGVAGRHDQGCTLALLRADCTEDVGGSGPRTCGASKSWRNGVGADMTSLLGSPC